MAGFDEYSGAYGGSNAYGSSGYSFGDPGGLGQGYNDYGSGGRGLGGTFEEPRGGYGGGYAESEPFGAGHGGYRSSSYDTYGSYGAGDAGLGGAFSSMDLGGGGGGGGGSAYERGLDNYGDEAYRRSHSQPHTSSGLGHYSSHASPYERDTYSADPYRSGHGGLSGGYTSGFDRSDPYDTIGASPRDYSSGGHLGSGGGDLYGAGGSGLPPAIDIDRNYSMSEPPGSRIRDIGYGADHLHSDPLSHSRHDSLGLDGFGLSSPLTGHSPTAFDYANMPEDLELDPSYGGPRDSFGASGMGLSPGMHATPDLGGMGDSYATPHAYGARRGSLDRHIDDAFGTGGGIGGLDHHGVSGEYSGLGGQYGDYGYGRDRGLGDDYMPAVDGTTYPEPARAHDAFGMGATSYDTRFRDEPSAFDSYMNRQTGYDPLGYDTALTTRDPLHAADIPTGHSLSRHSSLDHALDHSRPGAVFDSDHGHSSSYSSHHSPYFEASAGLSPHTPHTPLSSTSHLDMGHSPYEDNFEPHYDYGGFAWSGRLDNEEERYHDLDFYKQSLLRNQALDDSARENAWRERMEWENLDNEARQSRWRQLDEQKRYDLGLSTGFWGASLESDPLYYQRTVAPWADGGHIRPHPDFHIDSNHPVYNIYNQYYQPSYVQQPSHDQDHVNAQLLQAADLAAYSNALARDNSIREEDRRQRWEDRLQWEALAQHQRAERYKAMAEDERLRLGLGPHSYHSFHYGVSSRPEQFFPHFERLQSLKYPLPRQLQNRYSQFIGRPASTSLFRQPNWELAATYYDLLRYENELRHARNLSEAQRQKLWRQRIAWQQLGEAQRQIRWLKMKQRERQLLGIDARRFMGSRYASLGGGYRPGVMHSAPATALQLAMPSDLQRRFEPYRGRSFRVSRYPSWINSAMPGAKNMRNKLQEQKLRMAEINRKQAALHRLEAQKIRGREAETSHLMHELGPGSKTFVAPH